LAFIFLNIGVSGTDRKENTEEGEGRNEERERKINIILNFVLF
jgi:hypothetical protein